MSENNKSETSVVLMAMSPELETFLRSGETERIELIRQSNAIAQANGELVQTVFHLFPKPPTEEDIARHNEALVRDKRDWFAGAALGSVMQDRAIWDCTSDERRDIAAKMYEWADAMLAERSKP